MNNESLSTVTICNRYWPDAFVKNRQTMQLSSRQVVYSLNFGVLFIQLKSRTRNNNGRHLYSYPLLQSSLCLWQFSFFTLNAAKERFCTCFIERDQYPERLSRKRKYRNYLSRR